MITTKRNPVIAVFSALALVIIMAVLSFGAYLILQKPLTAPRAMYGFGIFIALLGIYPANSSPRAAAIPALALSWCFFVFSFSYGNALADQKRYSNFRTEILLKDLSTLFPDKTDEEIFIQLRNNINYAPSIDNIASRNPVIRRLVPGGLGSGWVWGYTNLVHYYRFKSVGSDRLIDTAEDERLEVALDTYYHTIKTDGGRVLVILK
jgi:hypothetical protein